MAKKANTGHRRVLRAARLRLMPLTLAMLSLLLLVKLNDLYIGSRQLTELLSTRDARAEEKAEEAKPTEETKPAEEVKADAKAEESHGDEKAAEDGHGSGKPVEEPKTFGEGKMTVKQAEELKAKEQVQPYSQTELDILQNLAKRRDELDKRAKDLDLKATMLDATEKRVNDRIGEMKTLQTELSKVVEDYKKQQNTEVMSLVKIYENMKPQDAANIFNELDMPILLEVIDRMSERKVAPVLAGMDPKKARDVTVELAELRRNRASVNAAADKATTGK